MAIRFSDVVIIIKTIVPLYFSMALAYICVRWVKVFSPEHNSGIGRFLRTVAIPLLLFKIIASNDFYAINLKLFAADTMHKLVILAVGLCWKIFSKNGSVEWVITFFSLCCLPNTVIIGLPLLDAMYGVESATVIIQSVVFQGVIWMNVLLTIFEYRTAKLRVSKLFPDSSAAASSPPAGLFIESFRVDSDAFSLGQIKSLRTDDSMSESEKMQEMVRGENGSILSSSSSRFLSFDSAEIMPCSGHGSVNQELSACEARKTTPGLNNINEIIVSSNSKVVPSSNEFGEVVDDPEGMEASSAAGKMAAIDVACEKMDKVPSPPSATKLIFFMVLKKFLRKPNTICSFLGLAWSLLSFKLKIGMPSVVYRSATALADTSVIISMFSLGLFMGGQSNLISCRISEMILGMLCRFVVAPALMAGTSWVFGLRGVILHMAIIQAALPQAVVCFVYAQEYDVHPKILSTLVAVGMLVALPILICYYLLLGL